jgi:hypothetical protein
MIDRLRPPSLARINACPRMLGAFETSVLTIGYSALRCSVRLERAVCTAPYSMYIDRVLGVMPAPILDSDLYLLTSIRIADLPFYPYYPGLVQTAIHDRPGWFKAHAPKASWISTRGDSCMLHEQEKKRTQERLGREGIISAARDCAPMT